MDSISHRTRTKSGRSTSNFVISIILHVVIFLACFIWAAKEGYVGKGLQTITANIISREKKPEIVKTDSKANELRKAEVAKIVEQTKTIAASTTSQNVPPSPVAMDTFVPPPIAQSMSFGDVDDAINQYKTQIERDLRSVWKRPANVKDNDYVVEIELNLNPDGKVVGYVWKQGSGNEEWDSSVKNVLNNLKSFSHSPPNEFPSKFVVKFDVVTLE